MYQTGISTYLSTEIKISIFIFGYCVLININFFSTIFQIDDLIKSVYVLLCIHFVVEQEGLLRSSTQKK